MPMILQGRYLSPFARRVGATMNLYGMDFEVQVLIVTKPDDVAKLEQSNPLGRVPALILEDGRRMIDSNAILDYLDEVAGPDKCLTPASGADRAEVLQLLALMTGTMERSLLGYYETARRPAEFSWPEQAEKLRRYTSAGLAAMEAALNASDSDWFACGRMTQADVSGVITYDYVATLHPDLTAGDCYPALAALSRRLNALPEVGSTYPSF